MDYRQGRPATAGESATSGLTVAATDFPSPTARAAPEHPRTQVVAVFGQWIAPGRIYPMLTRDYQLVIDLDKSLTIGMLLGWVEMACHIGCYVMF